MKMQNNYVGLGLHRCVIILYVGNYNQSCASLNTIDCLPKVFTWEILWTADELIDICS